jgi:hypothetical protein
VEPDCADVAESLSRGEALSAAALEHVKHCRVCSVSRRAERPADTDAVFAGIQASLGDEGVAGRIRSLPTGVRVFGAATWAALIVITTTVLRPRSAFGPVPTDRVLLVLSVLGLLLAVTLRLGLRPLQSPPIGRRGFIACFAAGLAIPVVFALLPAAGRPVDRLPGIAAARATVGCFVIGAVAGALLVGGMRLLDRGAHEARGSGLLAAIAGGLLGNAALELHCPITSHSHLLLGHATVGFALIAFYSLRAGRRARGAG